jgi:hypothetical protein
MKKKHYRLVELLFELYFFLIDVFILRSVCVIGLCWYSTFYGCFIDYLGRNHKPILSVLMTYHRVCNKCNTVGIISVARASYPSGTHEFSPIFSGFRVARSLFFFVVFVDHCLSFFSSFDHWINRSSFIYGSDYPFGIFKLF